MIHTLENQELTVSVTDHGAELCSIYDKKNDREVIWQADPAFWKRHAPVLFPNVGRHYGDRYRLGGKEYPSSQHGFARDSEFTCIGETEDSLTHTLLSSDETKKNYPSDFELQITHSLTDRTLTVKWKVKNTGSEVMYFTIGGHPAFALPDADGKEFHLSFEGKSELSYCLIDTATGTAIPDVVYSLPLTEGSCPVGPHMFDKDALIFDGQIERAAILLPDKTPYVELCSPGFSSFGIWSVPGAPFICLEPWMGRCDNCGFAGDLSEKPGIISLEPGEIFEKDYQIRIY